MLNTIIFLACFQIMASCVALGAFTMGKNLVFAALMFVIALAILIVILKPVLA